MVVGNARDKCCTHMVVPPHRATPCVGAEPFACDIHACIWCTRKASLSGLRAPADGASSKQSHWRIAPRSTDTGGTLATRSSAPWVGLAMEAEPEKRAAPGRLAAHGPPSTRRVTTTARVRPLVWPNAADPVAQRSRHVCGTVSTWSWNLARIVPVTAWLCAASTSWAAATEPRRWSRAE